MFFRSTGIAALKDYKMLKSRKTQYDLYSLLQAGKMMSLSSDNTFWIWVSLLFGGKKIL
jgi:hypothetical protein